MAIGDMGGKKGIWGLLGVKMGDLRGEMRV